MVIEEEMIMYRNVVWHSYEFHYSDFEKVLHDFNAKLTAANLSINGPLIYALKNVPLDERMDIDVLMPVEQSYVPRETNLLFQTYYYVDQMLMTRVKGNFETNTELGYERLFTYAMQHDLQIVSPVYHILRGDDDFQWVELKVKVDSNAEELPDREMDQLTRYVESLVD